MKATVTNESELFRDGIPHRIAATEAVMFDIDGCLLLSDQPSGHNGLILPGALEAVQAVRATGRRLLCFTNGSMQPPSKIAETLRGLGLDIEDEEVLTPAVVAAETIRTQHAGGRVLAFGGEGVLAPFDSPEVEIVDVNSAIDGDTQNIAAVVAGWDTEFGRSKIQAASEAILGGAILYTTSDVPTFASQSRLNVGVSSFIAAGLAHVTKRPYKLVGKPSIEAIEAIALRTGVSSAHTLIVGDDLDLEATMAKRCGALGVLVTTGTHSRRDAIDSPPERQPDAIIESLHELAESLRTHPHSICNAIY